MGGRQYSNDLQSAETGPRTFLDYNWVPGYIQGRIVVDELEIGSKEGGHYNGGTKNNP
ncbi:hypothetical protein NA56DRAFT_641202 [Hyaloscypha hepaticicola]|uniref:Uncharacterized protein n=1 Tax=Hyaloscypha hepaticicola TaxID=2082293 RepID=A0A2J6QJR4_9HELO|nr:hypothetical protein NA56DRAFT_641202 [Hyaloscypha hepaticicola]